MSKDHFNRTIDFWIKELDQYDFVQLCTNPSTGKWSIGQVYMHLVDQTNYFLEQARICASNNDNADKKASDGAVIMFSNNEFPNEIIEGPPDNEFTPQPVSKAELLNDMLRLKEEINEMAALISGTSFRGKTQHPGLNYFNAAEWFQFAEMRFRHHLRQKKRLDDFLKMNI